MTWPAVVRPALFAALIFAAGSFWRGLVCAVIAAVIAVVTGVEQIDKADRAAARPRHPGAPK